MPQKFLVLAASGRSIARSVSQAGHKCNVIDLFCDWDTQKLVVSAYRVSAYHEMCQAAEALELQVVLGSGIENYLAQMDRGIGRKVVPRIMGSSLSAIQATRDPYRWKAALDSNGIPCLKISTDCPIGFDCLWKPIYSGGGIGIKRGVVGKQLETLKPNPDGYYQEFMAGRVVGASFVVTAERCELLGVCSQFCTQADGAAGVENTFQYGGSIGPLRDLPELVLAQIRTIGSVLANACELKGWFGIDFVIDNGQVWVLEINPRFTASMEIIERVQGVSFFASHLNAAIGQGIDSKCIVGEESTSTKLLGKQYIFNESDETLTITDANFRELSKFESQQYSADALQFVTDVPFAGSLIEPKMPVCTVWAFGESESEVMASLNDLQCVLSRSIGF